jgi:hypothetical protein
VVYDRKPHTFNSRAAFRILRSLKLENESSVNLFILAPQLLTSLLEILEELMRRSSPILQLGALVIDVATRIVNAILNIAYRLGGFVLDAIKVLFGKT